MRALSLLVFLLASGTAMAQRRPAPSGCQEDFATCKEDCTIEYGGKASSLSKLSSCLEGCQEDLGLCSGRHSAVRGREVTPEPMPESNPRREAFPEPEPRSNRDPDEEFNVDRPRMNTTERKGVYRASDLASAPRKSELGEDDNPFEPTSNPEPVAKKEPPPPPPAPAKPPPSKPELAKSSTPAKPLPAPEPSSDDEEPPPPPPPPVAKKPTYDPVHPPPPPEPKRKDISEWDPEEE